MRLIGACTVVAALALAGGLSGCGSDSGPAVPEPASAEVDADRLLAEARRAALDADHLAVVQSNGERHLFSRAVNVLKRRGRVWVWVDRRQALTWRPGLRCYERDTEDHRADNRDIRGSAAPPDLTGTRLVVRRGKRVLLARERHMDFADTEFQVRLRLSGRPLRVRQRQAVSGVLPASAWFHQRYQFLSAAEFNRRAGGPPGPRCNLD